MATDATMTHGPALDAWLAHLDAEGFAIGLRERLVVQRLMLQLAAQGELPTDLRAMLALAMPLLCTRPEQQRRYQDLLANFQLRSGEEASTSTAALPPAARKAQRRNRLWLALGVTLALVLLVSLGHFIVKSLREQALTQEPPQTPAASQAAPASAPRAESPADDGLQVFVPSDYLAVTMPDESGWRQPLQWLLVTVGTFASVLLVGQLWARRQRQLYLQGVRSDEDVREHLLRDANPVRVGPSPSTARAVARGLRQRVEGDALALDVAATLRASVRAGGALAPRWRALQRTPEYLVLVEQRHASDHHSAYVHALLDALADAGVALDTWHFDGTPALGCWPAALEFGSDAAISRRVGVGELLTRHTGHRLLVFGPVQALLDPLKGSPQRWTTSLSLLPQRVWFTPLPLQAWGNAEAQADALGFLLLPQQVPALDTLAGWLASQRLELAVQADWPLSYPALLRDNTAAWAAREAPPDAATLAELLFQLRTALGPQRMRWLWACAVFPALSPPLTLALGRELIPDDPRALALGASALAALPWFRYGRLPDWLREALLDEMATQDPALQQQLRPFIERRLDGALLDGNAPVLARVATPQRVAAWLQRGRGLARDLVMVRFLEEDSGSRLLQRLPEGLRRRLFKNGLPALGLRLGVLAWALAAASVALAISWGSVWPLALPPLLAFMAALRATRRWAQGHSPAWQARWFVQGRPAEGLRWGGRLLLGLSALLATSVSLGLMFMLLGYILTERETLTATSFPLPPASNTGDSLSVEALAFAPDGQSLNLRVSGNGHLRLDLRTGAWLPAAGSPPEKEAVTTLLAKQGHVRVVLDAEQVLRLSALGSDGRWRTLGDEPHGQRAQAVALAPDESRLALAQGATIFVYGSNLESSKPIHLALLDCEGARTVSPALREMATGARAWTSRLVAVAYTPEAFDRLHGRAARAAPRTITWGDRQGVAELPEAVQLVQRWAQGEWPDVRWTIRAVVNPNADPVIAVGACLNPPPANTPVQTDNTGALLAGVARMFDANADTRVQATQALEADSANLSEVVPLAVDQALKTLETAGAKVDNTVASGVINTLVLLQAASPETLRANGPPIADLLERAAALGPVSAGRAKAVAARVAQAAKLRPQVFIQYAGTAQRPLALALQRKLQGLKYDVPGIEDVSGKATLPQRPEVRSLGASDRLLSTEVSVESALVMEQTPAYVSLPQRVDNDRYELWLDADACVGRKVPACYSTAAGNKSRSAGTSKF
ncbi:hypothetical protein BurJ1DRAFT_4751 [Burkholderiales bacterium JOSHI_001]|nr:hypothetical protein BurJ1DRAFT_4751 [Burkholderiales bacterium JOSHI_001]